MIGSFASACVVAESAAHLARETHSLLLHATLAVQGNFVGTNVAHRVCSVRCVCGTILVMQLLMRSFAIHGYLLLTALLNLSLLATRQTCA